MQTPSKTSKQVRGECCLVEKVSGRKEVLGFLSSLCWHKEIPPGWGVRSHHKALEQDLTSSSIPMSSSPRGLPGSLRRTKHPKRSPIPAVQPRGRYLFGHTLSRALLLDSLEGTHQQYSNPGVPWIFQIIGFAPCSLYDPGNEYALSPEDQAGDNTAHRCGFVEIKIPMNTKT